MYTISVTHKFCYGHRLQHYDGKCKNLHGHNGKAEITLEFDQLDKRGLAIDFTDVKKIIGGWIDQELDHKMILGNTDPYALLFKENDIVVKEIDSEPSAENLAKLIFEHAKFQNLPVKSVTMWESEDCVATYMQR